MQEIFAIITDARDKLKAGGPTFPRGIGTELIHTSAYWNTTLPTTVALYNNSEPCGFKSAWRNFVVARPEPESESDFGKYHSCNLAIAVGRLRFAYTHTPPGPHLFWNSQDLGWAPGDVMYWLYGTSMGMSGLQSAQSFSYDKKKRLIKTGWFSFHDFPADTAYGGALYDEVQDKKRAAVEEVMEEYKKDSGYKKLVAAIGESGANRVLERRAERILEMQGML